jgi:hypothetical protein
MDTKVPVQSFLAGMRLAFAEALPASNARFDVDRFLRAAQPRPTAYMDNIERLRRPKTLAAVALDEQARRAASRR